ncbi:MAG: type II toxin-antitoxin system RelE/ParE family toxin [Opitutales bacterium]|jgi:mRNA interferase RelE/StbE
MGRAIDALLENPRPPGGKAMTGLDKTWRIRVGEYRVIYEVQDDRLVVLVIRVGHRGDVYR